MITRIKIKNINSIDECDISFEKGKFQYLEENVFHDRIVNPIAFYGTNGSGKTSFLTALWQLTLFMINDPNQLRSFTPNYAHLPNNINEPIRDKQELYAMTQNKSSIEIFFEIDNAHYCYFLETSLLSMILREKLTIDNINVFERYSENYKKDNQVIAIAPSLFPVLRKIANEIDDRTNKIRIAYDFLANIGHVNAYKSGFTQKAMIDRNHYDVMVEHSQETKSILSKYKEFPLYDITSQNTADGHKLYIISLDMKNKKLNLPLQLASSGMHNTSMLLTLVLTLPKHGVLVIDEIEDALHPLTIVDFLKVVKEKDIQLIFTSHNTFILQQLRPDQIIFANWKNGCSTYKKLSDIYPNIRQVNNIEKMYLSGVFDEDINK